MKNTEIYQTEKQKIAKKIRKHRKKVDYGISSEKEERNKKYTYFDKLFIRIFLSSLILLSLTLGSKLNFFSNVYKKIENSITTNFNFLTLAQTFNGIFGTFIPIDDSPVFSSTVYDKVDYDKNINKITNYDFNGVVNLTTGVITKIQRNSDNTYNVTIQGIDDYIYTYSNLASIDHNIYSYVKQGDIIGLANKNNSGNYNFELLISKKGVYYNYYEVAED